MPLTKIRAAGIADDCSQTQAGSIHIGTSFSSANNGMASPAHYLCQLLRLRKVTAERATSGR